MGNLQETIADRLREARRAKGMTQAELAEASGISLRAISDLEAGKRIPRPSNLKALAEVLGHHPEAFYREAGPGAPDADRSTLIGQIVAILPALDELELRNILATAQASPSISRAKRQG